LTRADEARLAQERQAEALAAATAEYRRLSPFATGDKLAVSGEVNRMIAAAINADPRWFWEGLDARRRAGDRGSFHGGPSYPQDPNAVGDLRNVMNCK
jgi:hypothetical protein